MQAAILVMVTGLTGATGSTLYEISFRAKWITGSNQLHTRFWMNRVASNTHLGRPLHVGTPSAPNSRAESNIGPTFNALPALSGRA